ASFAVVLLAAHGAAYLTLKTEGPVHDRCEVCARVLWAAAAPAFLAASIESWLVRPELPGQAIGSPACWLGLLGVAVAIYLLSSGLAARREARVFAGSNLLLAGLLATGAAATFPEMLHSTLSPDQSLTAYAVAASPSALLLAAIWWPVAAAL